MKESDRRKMLDEMREKGYAINTDGSLEHRIVYKNYHGAIPKGWVIHHIDENKRNNDIKNLIALPKKFHNWLHKLMWEEQIHFNREQLQEFLNQHHARQHQIRQELEILEKQLGPLLQRRHELRREFDGMKTIKKQIKKKVQKPTKPKIHQPKPKLSKAVLRKNLRDQIQEGMQNFDASKIRVFLPGLIVKE